MDNKEIQSLQRQEIINLAMNDFELFCKLFIKIKTKSSKILPFTFNKEQSYLHNKIQSQLKTKGMVRTIIVKARQVGITTYCSARLLHNTSYNFAKNGAIVANYSLVSENIRNNLNFFLNNIPNNLKPEPEINNTSYLQFKGLQSNISYLTSGTNAVGRSNTLHYLHGTELAYWQNGYETIASLFNAIPNSKGSEIILESTSNGSYGIFYKLVKQALNKEIDFEVLFLPWFWQSQYSLSNKEINSLNLKVDSTWLKYQQKYNLSNNQLLWAVKTSNLLAGGVVEIKGPCNTFKKEYPASLQEAFASYKTQGFINSYMLLQITSNKQNIANINPCNMVLGVDVARQGKDYSYIIDNTENCLGYFVNLKLKTQNLMELCNIIIKLIHKYNPSKVCIDTIGLGAGVYDRLQELGYGNILVAVNVANKAYNSQRYANKKAELWWHFKAFIENKARFIVNDETLKAQILSTKVFYNSFGKLQIQSKKENSSCLWNSTDAADAAVLTLQASYYKNITVENNASNNIIVY